MGAEEDRRREFVEGLEFCGKMEDDERSGDESSLLVTEEKEEEVEEESSSSSDSLRSSSSIDSSDVVEDASSSCSISSTLKYSSSNSSSASLSNCRGPLYELSELMSHLPMKRGLSKHYDGRSQSYTSLASVKSLEDLQKKEIIVNGGSSRKRLKLCRSYAGGLDKSVMSPRAVISKKGPNRGLSSSSSLGRRSPLAIASRAPVPVLKT